jgi:hypothetical protein
MGPAQKTPNDDDTLLIRSAESLGRVIGSLRRQLLGAGVPAGAAPEPQLPRRRRAAAPRKRVRTSAPRKTKKR